jgi:hypothetical protein
MRISLGEKLVTNKCKDRNFAHPMRQGSLHSQEPNFVGLAYQGKDIVFRFIIEYDSSRDFGP